MKETEVSPELVVMSGDILGDATELKARKGAYVNDTTIFAPLTGTHRIVPPLPQSLDQRAIVEETGHKAHGLIPEPGSLVLARVTKVMARMATADILCVGPKAVREKFAGIKMEVQRFTVEPSTGSSKTASADRRCCPQFPNHFFTSFFPILRFFSENHLKSLLLVSSFVSTFLGYSLAIRL